MYIYKNLENNHKKSNSMQFHGEMQPKQTYGQF